MPFTERQLEPIVYHLSENFPQSSSRAPPRLPAGGMRHSRKRFDLFEMTERIIKSFPSLQIHSRQMRTASSITGKETAISDTTISTWWIIRNLTAFWATVRVQRTLLQARSSRQMPMCMVPRSIPTLRMLPMSSSSPTERSTPTHL